MYTRVHAQKKHVLCGQVDQRETHPKKNFAERHTRTKTPKKVNVRTCVHVHMLKEITALSTVCLKIPDFCVDEVTIS